MPLLPIEFDPAYDVSRVPNQSIAAFVNCYAEATKGKGPFVIQGYPGYEVFASLPPPIRGMHWIPSNADVQRYFDALYVVAGTGLYSVAADGSYTKLGDIPGTSRVQMDSNRFQLAVLADTRMFVWDTETSVFSEVTDPDFPGGSSIATINGFGLVSFPDGDGFGITAINDYTSFNSLDRATAESKADPLLAIRIVQREPWFFGTDGLEVWNNNGAADFPFERRDVNGDIGCVSGDTAIVFDNTVFWLGRDLSGGMYVYRATGYDGQRISTPPVERLIQSAAKPEMAYAYIWNIDGHSFYTLVLDNGSVTYDATTGIWHQSTTGVAEIGRPHAPVRFTSSAWAFGANLLGDPAGNLCRVTFDKTSDCGNPLVREVKTPPVGQQGRRTSLMRARLELQGGLGGLTFDPIVLMAHSTDGGRTWEDPQEEYTGLIGEYRVQPDWGPQGQAADHALLFRMTDDAPFQATGGWVEIIASNRP